MKSLEHLYLVDLAAFSLWKTLETFSTTNTFFLGKSTSVCVDIVPNGTSGKALPLWAMQADISTPRLIIPPLIELVLKAQCSEHDRLKLELADFNGWKLKPLRSGAVCEEIQYEFVKGGVPSGTGS